MNRDKTNKRNDRPFHRRGRNDNRNRNENVSGNLETTKVLENENKVKVEITETNEYTRNLEPLVEGYRMPSITLYDSEEEEFNLSDDKLLKVYITIPSLQTKEFVNEVEKLDVILKEFPNLHCYLISNEPVFTQTRLSRSHTFEKFKILSDFKNREFARCTGTYIYEIGALVKAIFIVDKNDRLMYVKYYDDLHSNIDFIEINEYIQNHIN